MKLSPRITFQIGFLLPVGKGRPIWKMILGASSHASVAISFILWLESQWVGSATDPQSNLLGKMFFPLGTTCH